MDFKRHIIVDGWNAVHFNKRLEGILAKSGLDAAREELRRMLEPVHDFQGARLTIVYDGKGDEISIERPNGMLTFSEVFTPSFMTADELIEQLCATAKNPENITVVSRDNLVRLTSTTFGATALAPDKLFDLGEVSARGIDESIKRNKRIVEQKWKLTNAFSKLDELGLEINSAIKASRLFSKKLEKRKNRLELKKSNAYKIDKIDKPKKISIQTRKNLKSFADLSETQVAKKKQKISKKPEFSLKKELSRNFTLVEIAAAKVLDMPKKAKSKKRNKK